MDLNTLLTSMLNNGIGAICAAAILLFAWMRETKTIPMMLETFQRTMKEALDTFSENNEKERMIYQKWHEENRDRLDKLMQDGKEHRHYLANLANLVGMRQAADRAVAEEKRAREARDQDSSVLPPLPKQHPQA